MVGLVKYFCCVSCSYHSPIHLRFCGNTVVYNACRLNNGCGLPYQPVYCGSCVYHSPIHLWSGGVQNAFRVPASLILSITAVSHCQILLQCMFGLLKSFDM